MPGCGYCHRTDGTHTANCSKREGCKLCKKKSPQKCRWHGGPAGKTPRPPRRKLQPAGAPETNGHDGFVGRIQGLVQLVKQGKAAERELAAIEKAIAAARKGMTV